MGRRLLTISPELFLGLFEDGHHAGYDVIRDAIPKGAKVADVRMNHFAGAGPEAGSIEFLIEHELYDETREGDLLPSVTPQLMQTWVPPGFKMERIEDSEG